MHLQYWELLLYLQPIAFQIFSSVDWGSVFLGILAIGVLAVMAGLMGAFAPLIIAGAVAIAILGFALIPFAIAALIAGIGMVLIGAGLMMMSYGLSSITPDQIGTLLALGLAIFTFALLAPVVLFAGVAYADILSCTRIGRQLVLDCSDLLWVL